VASAARHATRCAIARPVAWLRCRPAFSGLLSLWCRAGRASVGAKACPPPEASSRSSHRQVEGRPESRSADSEPRVGAYNLSLAEVGLYVKFPRMWRSAPRGIVGCRRFRRGRPGDVTRVWRASRADGRVWIAPGQVPSTQIERSGSHQLKPAVSTPNPRHSHAPITTEVSSRRRKVVPQVFELPAAFTSGRVLASSASRSSRASSSSSVRRWSRDKSTSPESSEQSVCTRSLRAAAAESSLCMFGRRNLVR
jgi:hypothetical protein